MMTLLWILLSLNMYIQSSTLDIQGHRGARGLLPENGISGFLLALDYRVTTLEMDVVITGDNQVLVSHEPYFNPIICSFNGEGVSLESNNIYRMSLDAMRTIDCGRKGNPGFPEQKAESMYKPLLSEVIRAVEEKIEFESLYPVRYNIEIKSQPNSDRLFHPEPSEFSDLVYNEVSKYLDWERVTIQSFDYRVLRYFNDQYPEVELAQLVWKTGNNISEVEKLGFAPEIYSCYYKLLDKEVIESIQSKGIKVIPWTVNDAEDMKKLVAWGVDGIITDYPNIATEMFR